MGLLLGPRQGREEHRREDGDNSDHHEEFDEGKGPASGTLHRRSAGAAQDLLIARVHVTFLITQLTSEVKPPPLLRTAGAKAFNACGIPRTLRVIGY